MTVSRAGLLLVLGAAGTLASGEVRAEPTRLKVALDYSADPDCPDSSAFQAIVTARLRYDPFDPAAPDHVQVQLRRVGDGMQAHIEWHDAAGAWAGEQNVPLATDDCRRLARSSGFALAVQIEFFASTRAEQPAQAPPPPPPPPPAVTVATAPPAATVIVPTRSWHAGALSTVDHFSGGQTLAGADLFLSARIGRRFTGEVRLGGRVSGAQAIPFGQLTLRAATAGAAGGLEVGLSARVRLRLMVRAQAYLVEFATSFPASGGGDSATLGTAVLGLEPRLEVAVTRRLSLVAGGAAGVAVRGIGVRTQGLDTASVSGAALSADLGAAFAF